MTTSGCSEIWENDPDFDYDNLLDYFDTLSMVTINKKLKDNEPFSYVRLGDLEWRIMIHDRGNGEHFSIPGMRQDLLDLLSSSYIANEVNNDRFYVSFSNKLFRTKHVYDEALQIIQDSKMDYKFVDSDVFNEMLRYTAPLYMEFLDIMKTKNVVMIKNQVMVDNFSPNIWTCFAAVVIPKKNCYIKYNDIYSAIEQIISDNPTEQFVFMFSASATAPILIADLHVTYGDKHTFIDMGSFFDFFGGYASRTPFICAKDFYFDTYTDCMIVPSVDDVLDMSPSFA